MSTRKPNKKLLKRKNSRRILSAIELKEKLGTLKNLSRFAKMSVICSTSAHSQFVSTLWTRWCLT